MNVLMGSDSRVAVTDWMKIKSLAENAVDAMDDSKLYSKSRAKLLSFVNRLIRKYGAVVDLPATKADFLERDAYALELYRKAYRVAVRTRDYKNMTFIAESVADRLITRGAFGRGKRWLAIARENLLHYYDSDIDKSLKKLSKACRFRGKREAKRHER